jgi:anti-sigma B factor antagonist
MSDGGAAGNFLTLTVLESDPASGLLIVGVQGELDITTRTICQRQINDAVSAFAPETPRRLILDLSGCTFLDSTGMMFLIEQTKAARKNGSVFALAQLTPRLQRVFREVQLNLVFHIADTIEQAKSMQPSDER